MPLSWLVPVWSCAQAAFLHEDFPFFFHVLAQAQKILHTGSHIPLDQRDPLYCKDRNTDCHYVTAKSVGKSRNAFSYKYPELRFQHTSSLKIDSVHQVKRMRDEDKAQHLPGVLTHPETTHWEVHYEVFWGKLHSDFHAGVGPLYKLSYHQSRNVVSVS